MCANGASRESADNLTCNSDPYIFNLEYVDRLPWMHRPLESQL